MVTSDSTKEINGHVFTGWGAHAQNYRCAYLTAAAAIGMTKADVDTFLKRLDKCLSKFTAKEMSVARNVGLDEEQPEERGSECENGKGEISDIEATDSSAVNR